MRLPLLVILLTLSAAGFSQNNNWKTSDPGFEEPYNCETIITSSSFNRQLTKLRQYPTSIKRIKAKNLAASYCLSSNQVYKLIMILPSPADRLSIAKKSFANCPDQENYEIVFKAFRSQSLTDELEDYLSQFGYMPGEIGQHYPGTNNNLCRRPMTSSDFNAAKETLNKTSFDETKLETAKTIAATNCLKTDQVIEMCELFTFEQTKLDFAKYAYTHVVDKNNYFRVAMAFSFDASKNELNKFIQSNGK